MRNIVFFLISGLVLVSGNCYGAASSLAVQKAIIETEAYLKSLPKTSDDIQRAVDATSAILDRNECMSLGHVWSPLGFQYNSRSVRTPQVPGAIFIVPCDSTERGLIKKPGDWYAIVSADKEGPFSPQIASAENLSLLSCYQEKNLLFQSKEVFYDSYKKTVLESTINPVVVGNTYYVKNAGKYSTASKEIGSFDEGSKRLSYDYFVRMDGAITPHNRFDLAFATYPDFFKKIGLLGVETAANSLMYAFFKKAQVRHMHKTLITLAPHIIGGSVTLKALENRLRFMPFNPFHTRALPYLGAYMLLSELAHYAHNNISDFSYAKIAMKKVEKLFATHKSSGFTEKRLSPQYISGVPIPLYSIIEFLSTGRLGFIEKLGEVGAAATEVYAGFKSSWKKKALDGLRRFLIVYFTLQSIDKESVSVFMNSIKKNKAGFMDVLREVVKTGSEQAKNNVAQYVEKYSALRQRSLLSSALNHGKAKKVSQKLTDAQILFRHRLKALFFVNTVWAFPLCISLIFRLVRKRVS
ncbi:MAG: hypothetical protein WCJ17_02805 [bacterium]